jgi:hypothetical protein
VDNQFKHFGRTPKGNSCQPPSPSPIPEAAPTPDAQGTGEFKIQNSKFKIKNPTDKSACLNNEAEHFYTYIQNFLIIFEFQI